MLETIITPDMQLNELRNLPEFREIQNALLPESLFDLPRYGEKPLSAQADLWRLPLFCEGLNRALALRRAGCPVCLRYGPEPHQFLFHFPGVPGGRAVILCPGGAYSMVSLPNEGYPVAARLNSMGYHAVVVNYRTGAAAAAPGPLDDLAAALRFLQARAGELEFGLDGYLLMGFSAGGHLAGCLGTESLGWKRYGLPRPGAMALCYPVVTMGADSEPETKANLLGMHRAEPDWVRRYSLELQITADYPPTYLWQYDHDRVVPAVNSRLLDRALTAGGVPHEYETFPGTDHGTGLADGTAAAGWLDRAVRFWNAK